MKVFFARSKPYGLDAVEIAYANNVVFIGYPLPRPRAKYDPANVHSCVVNLNTSDDEWRTAKEAMGKIYGAQAQANRNLAREIGPGDIALLPHAREGVVFAGIVVKGFELIDRPPWLDEFLRLLPPAKSGGPDGEGWHAAEVAQVCRVHRFVPIPISELGQLRASLLGRARFGRVASEGLDAHAMLSALMQGQRMHRAWTLNPDETLSRLQADLTPTDFEYLVVSVLQLEHPEEVWRTLGGPGDGGVDGAAIDAAGHPCAVLQCKLRYGGEPIFTRAKGFLHKSLGTTCRRYVAALFHPERHLLDTDAIFLDAQRIAELVIKHHGRLPAALSLRIGTAS